MFSVVHFVKVPTRKRDRVVFAGSLRGAWGTWEIDTELVDPSFLGCRDTVAAAANAGLANWGHYAPSRVEATNELFRRAQGLEG